LYDIEYCVWTPNGAGGFDRQVTGTAGYDGATGVGFALRDTNDGFAAGRDIGRNVGVWTVATGASWWTLSPFDLVSAPPGGLNTGGPRTTVTADGDVAAGYYRNVWQKDINDDHVIVGQARTVPDRKGMYTYKGFIGKPVVTGGVITSYQLEDLTALAGVTVSEANAINNNGWIAARGGTALLLKPK
jgi:hypothetical protein